MAQDDSKKTEDALPLPTSAKSPNDESKIHPAVYIAVWIGLSGSVIIFNKWILDRKKFTFPITLTTWHMIFATITTQILAHATKSLDSRHKVPMNGRLYLRAIVPIGIFFSLSLMFSNVTYLYLSVSFIQMLRATNPVVTLLMGAVLGTRPLSLKTLGNVSIIVLGVVIASYGEIKFVLLGVIFCMLAVFFEATRLTLVESLLNSPDLKMDPVVSLYYTAPVCAVMNGIVALVLEVPKITMPMIWDLGIGTIMVNAAVAFLLNIAVVTLIGRTSALVLTLSGVLKDILLVIASMIIFLDPVTPLQAFGYSIALSGLVYYKLGGEKLVAFASQIGETIRRANRILLVVMIFLLFIVMGALGQHFIKAKVPEAPLAWWEQIRGKMGV